MKHHYEKLVRPAKGRAIRVINKAYPFLLSKGLTKRIVEISTKKGWKHIVVYRDCGYGDTFEVCNIASYHSPFYPMARDAVHLGGVYEFDLD